MSAREAFCTLRILPRIGSSAWNSEFRASLAVPSAESPSTMNSSLRSSAGPAVHQLGRQRRAGQRGLAALVVPVLAGGDPGLGRRDDLLQHRAGLLLAAARPGLEEALQLGGDHLGDDPGRGRGAEHLLGLPLELRLGQPDGDDRGQALQHVFLGHRLVAVLEQPGRAELLVQRPDHGALEAGDVGAALGRGDDVDEGPGDGVVAAAPAQRHVDLSSRSTSVGVMWPRSSSTGTVSVKLPEPVSRSTSVTGSPDDRCSQNSLMPPSKRNSASRGAAGPASSSALAPCRIARS